MLRRGAQETPPFQLTLAGVMHRSPAISHHPESPPWPLTASKKTEVGTIAKPTSTNFFEL